MGDAPPFTPSMVFSSPAFLFLYLPLVLALYFSTPSKGKNLLLLVFSLAFYSIGAGAYTLVLATSVALNFFFGRRIARRDRAARIWLAFGVCLNLAPLLFLKYGGFALRLTERAWGTETMTLHLFLPAGISFFTFQAIAYLVDVARGAIEPSTSMVRFGLFETFFPQLIAGPIVRYQEIAPDLVKREHSIPAIAEGLERFGRGLGKKILLADNLGRVADVVFNGPTTEWSASNAWLALLCYTLQIFFDFSGYSDMAIGLGRVFGLRLPENFRQPYRATSVTDFWRRWHITLSSFFRDYLYIPLGGNRRGRMRTSLNLLCVFALCGLWHGARENFLVWGLFHGAFLLGEKLVRHRLPLKLPASLGWAYTLGVVMIGWVIFRSPDISHAGRFLVALFGQNHADPVYPSQFHLTWPTLLFLSGGWIWALWRDPPTQSNTPAGIWAWARTCSTLLLMAWALAAQSTQSFNPFIYFQF